MLAGTTAQDAGPRPQAAHPRDLLVVLQGIREETGGPDRPIQHGDGPVGRWSTNIRYQRLAYLPQSRSDAEGVPVPPCDSGGPLAHFWDNYETCKEEPAELACATVPTKTKRHHLEKALSRVHGRRGAPGSDGIITAHLGYNTDCTINHQVRYMNHRAKACDDDVKGFQWVFAKVNYTPERSNTTTPRNFRPLVAASHLKNMHEMALRTMMEDRVEDRLQS